MLFALSFRAPFALGGSSIGKEQMKPFLLWVHQCSSVLINAIFKIVILKRKALSAPQCGVDKKLSGPHCGADKKLSAPHWLLSQKSMWCCGVKSFESISRGALSRILQRIMPLLLCYATFCLQDPCTGFTWPRRRWWATTPNQHSRRWHRMWRLKIRNFPFCHSISTKSTSGVIQNRQRGSRQLYGGANAA